jgi:hypothetical protein
VKATIAGFISHTRQMRPGASKPGLRPVCSAESEGRRSHADDAEEAGNRTIKDGSLPKERDGGDVSGEHGTHVPVEEPSIASEADIRLTWPRAAETLYQSCGCHSF